MQIHGTAVTIGQTKYTILFTSLSYRDWIYYLNSDQLYTPAALRYLFKTYVTEITSETIDASSPDMSDKQFIDADILLHMMKPAHIQQILDLLMSKSGYASPEAFDTQLAAAGDSFRTHYGLYDLFLFLNLSLDEYLTLLDAPADTRTRIIAALQIKRGLTVKARVDDAEKNREHGIALDLVNSDAVYEENIKQLGYSRVGETPQKRRLPPEAEAVIQQTHGNAFDEATRQLQEKLRRDKQAPRKTFDWRNDEHDFINNDIDSDSSALNATPER